MATREELRARPDEAALLMPPVPWDQVATKTDVAELQAESSSASARWSKIGALDSKIGALDSKIGALEGKIGSQAWKIVMANIGAPPRWPVRSSQLCVCKP